jgi:very-short-patch-repair endonuclease
MPSTNPKLLERARQMRSEMTQPERELWIALRAKRFNGVKFTRQVVIGPYIADFVCRSRKLIIELDGATHDDASRDDQRTAFLEAQGYRVIRFWNNDVMTNLDGVLGALSEALATAPFPNPLPGGERA